MTRDEVIERLRQAVVKAGSQARWAEANGVKQGTVADVLRGRSNPGPKLLRALGLREAGRMYEEIEPDAPHD